MRKSKPIICITIAAFLLGSSAADANELNKSAEPEWVVKQSHKDLGRVTMYVSRNAIKISNTSWGYSLLSKAPDWKIITYRDDDKIEWKTTRSQFYKSYPVDLQGINTNHIGLQRSRAADCSGAKSWSYLMGGQTFWFAEKLGTPIEVDAAVSAYYGIRAQRGILTKYGLDFGKPKTSENAWLSGFQRSGYVDYLTTSSFKQVPYNPKDFAAPVGYKTAKDPYTITTSKAQKASGDAAMMELGLGEKLGH